MKTKAIVAVLSLLSMVGCQSTIGSNYTYIPNQLSQAVIDDLNLNLPQQSKNGSSLINIRFVEHESYIEVSDIAEKDFFFNGGNFNEKIYKSLCVGDQDVFFDFIRQNNLGVKYLFIDGRGTREIGPWNTDICNAPEVK